MAAEPKKTVVLKSSVEESTLEVEETAAMMSEKIKRMLSDQEGVSGGGAISVGDIDGDTLRKVMEYCRKHVEISTVVADKTRRDAELKILDNQFVDVDPPELFILVKAVYELKIQVLVDLTCETIASHMRGKSPGQIRRTFGIRNDFTPEERAEIAMESLWKFG